MEFCPILSAGKEKVPCDKNCKFFFDAEQECAVVLSGMGMVIMAYSSILSNLEKFKGEKKEWNN